MFFSNTFRSNNHFKTVNFLVSFCCLSLIFTSEHLFSQQSIIDTIPDKVLQDVVIQATRAGRNSAIPHNNITAAQIAQQYQAQDIPFLLSNIPSLVESSDAGAGVGYTGMRIRGSDPTRVNVTINGVPLNDAESQGVFWVNLPDLAASADEIQVQRGVGSSTNGAGAFGATVNIDLSKVQQKPFGRLTTSFGSFDTRKYSAMFGTGLLNGKLSLTGRMSAIQSDGFVDRARADLNAIHLTGTYIQDRQSVQVHFLNGRERTYQAWNGLPAQYLENEALRSYNISGNERAESPHPNEVDNYTQRHILLHYKRQLATSLQLQLNGHYTRGFGYFEQYKAAQTLTDYGMRPLIVLDDTLNTSDLIRRRWLDNYFYGSTWALKWNPTSKADITFGGAVSRYEGTHFGEVIWAQLATEPSDFRYYENDATKNDANAFIKIELEAGRKVHAMLDLQIRRVQYEFLGFDNQLRNVNQQANLLFFNPKAGIEIQVRPQTALYGFVGIGNREPNRDDYTQSSPSSRPTAERMYNVETGVRHEGAKWRATANLFGMYYSNQLVVNGRINDVGGYIRTNIPKSYRAGIEMEAQVQLSKRVHLEGNLSLSQNKVRDFVEYRDNWDTGLQEAFTYKKTDLAFSPQVVTRAALGCDIVQHTRQQMSVQLIGKYVGQQYLDNTSNPNTALPGFGFSDLRINYQIKDVFQGNLKVIAAIQNLFDAKYVSNGWTYRYTSAGFDPRATDPYTRLEGGNTYHQAGFFPQAGRNYMVSVIFEW